MKRMWGTCAALCCAFLALAGCSAAEVADTPSSTTTVTVHTTIPDTASAAEAQTEEDPAGIHGSNRPLWRVDSIQALDTLLANADGYASYYFFAETPPGFTVTGANVAVDGIMCHFYLENAEDRRMELYVYPHFDGPGEPAVGSKEMILEGVTYYCAEELDDNGEVLLAGISWREGDAKFIVHTQEPITADVIRKYNRMEKVEFNIGQEAVGYAAGTPLISDPEKIERLVRENSGIIYVDPTVDTAVDTAD